VTPQRKFIGDLWQRIVSLKLFQEIMQAAHKTQIRSWVHLNSILGRRIAIAVFIAVLLVEAAILLPSYMRREAELLQNLKNESQQWLYAKAAPAVADLNDEALAQALLEAPGIVGVALQTDETAIWRIWGELKDLPGSSASPFEAKDMVRRSNDRRLQVAWNALESPLARPVSLLLKSEEVNAELQRFVLRIMGLVLIISLVLTITTLVAVRSLVLSPMLKLRNALAIGRNAAWFEAQDSERRRKDEIGDVYRVTHRLLERLEEAHRTLEGRVERRTQELKLSYRQLSQSEKRFRDFAEVSSDWFWEMDRQLRFSYFSDRFTDITGVPQSRLLGKTREESGNPGVSLVDWNGHLSVLHAHQAFHGFIHPRTKPDGTQVWLSISGKPVFANGRFIGYRGTGRDITRRVNAEAIRDQALQSAKDASEAKSEFLATMSHEFRTPLNAILGFSELIRDQVLGSQHGAKYSEYAADIHDSGTHLLSLINDILDVSKIEAGKLQLRPEWCDVQSVVENCLQNFEHIVQAKDISLEIDIAASLPSIWADRRAMYQALTNLVSNAVKFTPNGGKVRVCADAETTCMRICVHDSGIGIEADDLERLGKPFTQLDKSSPASQSGTGLGLTITKALVRAHNGRFNVESCPGEGTSVTIELPLQAKPHAEASAGAA